MIDMALGDTALIVKECRKAKLTKAQTAYVLATAKWETAHTMRPVREAFHMSETWRKEKLRYFPFYGRGYVQLTWAANYKKAGELFGADLENNPDLALEPKLAAKILVNGMKDGWFTSKKLADYTHADGVDFVSARAIVNGSDRAMEIAKIAREYLPQLSTPPAGLKLAAPAAALGGVLYYFQDAVARFFAAVSAFLEGLF